MARDVLVTMGDFHQWRDLPVTKMLYEYVAEFAGYEVSALAQSAGINPPDDRYKVGKIAGLALLADWTPNLVEDE